MILPAALGNHHAAGRLRHEEDRLEVDLQHVVPVGLAVFQRGRAADDAGVVHEDVQPAHLGDDLGDDGVQIGHRGLAQIAADLHEAAAQRCHRRAGLIALAAIQPDDIGAGLGQPERHRLPKPARRACHQRHAAVETEKIEDHVPSGNCNDER